MVDGHHSSAAISLTNIFLGGGRRLYKSLLSRTYRASGAQEGAGRARAKAMARCARDNSRVEHQYL